MPDKTKFSRSIVAITGLQIPFRNSIGINGRFIGALIKGGNYSIGAATEVISDLNLSFNLHKQ